MPNREEIRSKTTTIKTELSILTKRKHTLKLNEQKQKQKQQQQQQKKNKKKNVSKAK